MADQRRDPWRVLWRVATSDEVLVALLLATAASVALTAWIPQRPSSDVDYARWLSQTQARFGAATSAMRSLGLFGIVSSAGFRSLLALLSGSLLLRLVEGIDRVLKDGSVDQPTGGWQPIPSEGLAQLVDRLRRRRYRVVNVSSFVQVDRSPWSKLLPLVVYVGVLLLLGSLLLSHLFGWQVEGLILQQGDRRTLAGGDAWVSLAENGTEALHSSGVIPSIEASGPGVEVSAVDGNGDSLQLLRTSDAEPTTKLRLALTGDSYFAMPEPELIVRLTPRSEEPYARADVQIYSSPTGEIIAERVTERGGQATLSVRGVRATLVPAPYARLMVTRNPGRLPAAVGLSLVVIGVTGSLLWSERRFWLRSEDDSVEVAGPFPSWLQHPEKAR